MWGYMTDFIRGNWKKAFGNALGFIVLMAIISTAFGSGVIAPTITIGFSGL